MQIRELTLKELYEIYDVIKELRDLTYDEFEDLIYAMRESYKMLGVLERGELVSFAGCAVQTSLAHNRHLYVYDFLTRKGYDKKKYDAALESYLKDYAKIMMCKEILFASDATESL